MSVESAVVSSLANIFEVEVEIRGHKQIEALITKIQEYAFLKSETYHWGFDKWNRQRREKAVLMVLVKRDDERAFKIMLTQNNNHSPLNIIVKKLTNFY